MTDSSNLQFVDSNILVYAHDVTAGNKRTLAKSLIEDLWELRNGCLSIQVLQEFFVTITQKVTKPFDVQTATEIIDDLSTWQVHSPRPQDILDAIELQKRYQVSFWDAMILQSAIRLGCDTLWSEDLNPGQIYHSIQLLNPLITEENIRAPLSP